MAKINGPLFSMSASGQIAKTLVYSQWKGIPYVRQHVVPANPNTADQQTQRGYLTTALGFWHDTVNALNAVDKANLAVLATVLGRTMSGFNAFVRGVIKTAVAGETPVQLYNTVPGTPTATTMQIAVNSVQSTNTVNLKYGTSKTALNYTQTRDENPVPGATHTFSLTGLSPSTLYYYTVRQTTGDANHSLGIGSFTTPAS